ncbi:hypothetical protein MSAN_00141600 [Mycena sanguinolenta]|uniref:Uncharacterized protein n=1 Tax=Mycena sanguinolenta TaxID=230812 RepID=A0A8H6ZGR2_9AGAR|nr:hypothetical protein MSAN_00141600 [Mycena sanguinolenta]
MLRSHIQPSSPHLPPELPCQPCLTPHSPVLVSIPSPPPLPMPARRDHIAPVFDPHAPHTLPKYFSDLEFLFLRSCITTDSKKKYHATRFLELDEQELWECVPEFADPTASFTELTTAIFRLYPEADPERRHSRADLDALVSELSRLPSLSRTQFANFYRSFFLISTFLIRKGRLSVFEQSFALRRAIPQLIWPQIAQRLAIKLPDVYPGDPYPLASLRDAVHFILADSSPSTPLSSSTSKLALAAAPFISESSETSAPTLAAAVDRLVDVLAPSVCVRPSASASCPVLPSAQSLPFPAASRPDLPPPPSPHPTSCSYCSHPAHFIARCPVVAADIYSGFCRRNTEGKVVLPSGSFVPHHFAGPNLRARIISWHAANPTRPAQPVASHVLAHTPTTSHAPVPCSHESSSTAPHSPCLTPASCSTPTSTISTEGRIVELESQLAALRSHARPITVDSLASYSPSTPLQPVSHSPPPSHMDLTSVYSQQQQNVENIDTHGFPTPPLAPAILHRSPAPQFALQSDFARVSSPEKSSLPRHMNPLSCVSHAVPHVVSPPFPREQETQSSPSELAHIPEPQNRPVPLQKSSPAFHANWEFPVPHAVPHAVSPSIPREQQPQPSLIELCRVSEAQSRFSQSQIPLGAESEFQQSCSLQNTVQRRPQCSRSSSRDLSMSQPHPASHSQLQLSSFAPEINQPAHKEFTASVQLAHNCSITPRLPDAVSSRPSSPADLISFD